MQASHVCFQHPTKRSSFAVVSLWLEIYACHAETIHNASQQLKRQLASQLALCFNATTARIKVRHRRKI